MVDGYELIARIPIRIAGPSRYMTASAVATMDCLPYTSTKRVRLGLPV